MKFLQQPTCVLNEQVMCKCNRPARIVTNIGDNQIRWSCEETYWVSHDIKINKGAPAWPIWDETKHGSPCDFVKVYDIPKSTTASKWERLVYGVLKSRDPCNIPKYGSAHLKMEVKGPLSEEEKGNLFKSTLRQLCHRARNRSTWSPITWEFISKFNYYAEYHLLIPPFQITGEKKETWEQFVDRFEQEEWVSKNWILRQQKFKAFEEKAQKRFENIEKQLTIFDHLPKLKRKVRKSLKKDWKKKEKDIPKNDKNIEHESFRKLLKKPTGRNVDEAVNGTVDEELEDSFSFEDDCASLNGGSRDDKDPTNDSDDETTQNVSSQSDDEEADEGDDDYGLDGDAPDYGDLAGDGFGGDGW